MILTQCAACAKPLAHDAPRCVRCWTRYCDASCQLEHWSAGHKKQCKKIARGGGAEQFYADAKYKEAAEAAVVESAPRIPADAICYICRNDGSVQGLVSGCGCHGGAGIAHLSCLMRQARISVEEDRMGYDQGFGKWQHCFICDQDYDGDAMVAIAWGCWKTYLGRPEKCGLRSNAMGALGSALSDYASPEVALPILQARLALLRRIAPHDKEWLSVAEGNLACCFSGLGRHAEALRLYRTVHIGKVQLYGDNHERTIQVGNNIADCMLSNQLYEDARTFARKQLHVARRALGERNELTIRATTILAATLYEDPATVRADVVEALALLAAVSNTVKQVFGPRHQRALQVERLTDNARQILSEFQPARSQPRTVQERYTSDYSRFDNIDSD